MISKTGWVILSPKLQIRFEQKWQDVWIGIYWHRSVGGVDIWLCILPTLPIHIRTYKVRQWD